MVTIFFIVEGARLEAQSALLAATLADHNGATHRLVAYAPPTALPGLPTPLRDLYDRCGVDLRPIEPDPDSPAAHRFAERGWARPYPHGNKILAAATPRTGDWSVFLDTDMICAAKLELEPLQTPHRLALVPEGVPSWGKENDRWQRAYTHFGLPVPEERVTLTRRRRKQSLPYFNAGFVMFPEAPPPGQDHGFGALWLDTALAFDWGCAIGGKRPWLDQITLPLTLKRFGLGYHVADTALNFSISDRTHEPDARPAILHYHRWRYLRAWPQGAEAFRTLDRIAGPALAARLHHRYDATFGETESA